jgi:hypothetical protein
LSFRDNIKEGNSTSELFGGTGYHLHCRYSQHPTLHLKMTHSSYNPEHPTFEGLGLHQCFQALVLLLEMPELGNQAMGLHMKG